MADNIAFSELQLRSRVDAKTYQRAQEYIGHFTHRTIDENEISGKVKGNYGTYTTFLRVSDRYLEGRCSCQAADEMFCKHSVALGLTYLEAPENFKKKKKVGRKEITGLDDISHYLSSVTLDDLVKELKEKGITQKRTIEILNMNPGLFGSAKRCEQRGRYYNFLGALKLSCLYLLDLVEQNEQPKK
jgi:uncharacterized Zn finger protein